MSFEFTLLPKRPGIGALLGFGIFLAYFAALLLGGYVSSLVLGEVHFSEEASLTLVPDSDEFNALSLVLRRTIGMLIGFSVIMLSLVYCAGREKIRVFLPTIGFVKVSNIFNIGTFIFGFSLNIFFILVVQKIFPFDGESSQEPLSIVKVASDWIGYLFLFNLIVLAAVNEEILFRGIVYKGFSFSFGKVPAALITTLLFVVMHIDTVTSGYWVSVFVLVLISFCFLIVREISGSLVPGIFMHAGANAVFVFPVLGFV